ncbi:hypothetical protein OG361_30055 [Streptomyces sp. NBC_00090]|uniref:hypothetical protein n=1 Tax=Streptomyces sp. NBC_00090 TaxID=2903619 RepID=UPI0032560B78
MHGHLASEDFMPQPPGSGGPREACLTLAATWSAYRWDNAVCRQSMMAMTGTPGSTRYVP